MTDLKSKDENAEENVELVEENPADLEVAEDVQEKPKSLKTNRQSGERNWYVIHTYSGYENKVAQNIEKVVENRKLHDLILEVRVPTEKVTEINDGKTKEVERKTFPISTLKPNELL